MNSLGAMDTGEKVIVAVGLALFNFVLIWRIAGGLKTGSVVYMSGSFERSEDPFFYWACLAVYLMVFLLLNTVCFYLMLLV